MKFDPLVSVCIPTYNGEKYIKQCINSAIDQTYSNIEIIVSDVFRFLKTSKKKFDIIIADPPYYSYDFLDLIPYVKDMLIEDGVFCYESEKQNIITDLDIKTKIFGDTQVIYWSK